MSGSWLEDWPFWQAIFAAAVDLKKRLRLSSTCPAPFGGLMLCRGFCCIHCWGSYESRSGFQEVSKGVFIKAYPCGPSGSDRVYMKRVSDVAARTLERY